VIQQLIIAALFIGALVYLGRIAWRNLRAKRGCATGCGKCSIADIEPVKNFKSQGNSSLH